MVTSVSTEFLMSFCFRSPLSQRHNYVNIDFEAQRSKSSWLDINDSLSNLTRFNSKF